MLASSGSRGSANKSRRVVENIQSQPGAPIVRQRLATGAGRGRSTLLNKPLAVEVQAP